MTERPDNELQEEPPLSPPQLLHYLFEVVRETEIAEDCFRRFTGAASSWLQIDAVRSRSFDNLDESDVLERDMIAAIEGILAASGRISLFFFPQPHKPFSVRRGMQLCNKVAIDDSHPIGLRDVRNDWMHFDERLDREVGKTGAVPIGYIFGRHQAVSLETQRQTFRLIDPGD